MKLNNKEHDILARKHFLRRQRVIPSTVLYDDVARHVHSRQGSDTAHKREC